MKRNALLAVGIVVLGSALLAFVFVSRLQPLSISAIGSANREGLRFDWDVKGKGDFESINIVIRKNDTVLQQADTLKRNGTYFITPYRKGIYTLDVQARSAQKGDNRNLSKQIVVSTEGNLPKLCPSHSVWMSTGSASSTKNLTLNPNPSEFLNKSQLIFSGNVTGVEFCAGPKAKTPYTFVTFDKLKIAHGDYSDKDITIAIPGGVMDGKVSEFSHTPKFKKGERVIVFLTARPQHLNPILGWQDGVFLIENDQVKNYFNQPVFSFSKDGLGIDTSVTQKPKPFDVAYGYHKVIQSEDEEVDDEDVVTVASSPAPKTLNETQFINAVQTLSESLGIKQPVSGKLLAAGTPFKLKPLKAIRTRTETSQD